MTGTNDGARDLGDGDAHDLFAAVFDGGVPGLELGAMLAALSVTPDTVAGVAGAYRAMAIRVQRLHVPDARYRPLVFPTYSKLPDAKLVAVAGSRPALAWRSGTRAWKSGRRRRSGARLCFPRTRRHAQRNVCESAGDSATRFAAMRSGWRALSRARQASCVSEQAGSVKCCSKSGRAA